jgi:hypothetical protein
MQPSRSTEGASRGVFDAGSGAVASESGRNAPASRRPKPHGSGAPAARHKGLTWRLARLLCQQERSSRGGPPAVDRKAPGNRGWYVHRGSCGASLKHRVRDAGILPAPRGKASMCFHLSHMDRGDRQSPASRAALTLERIGVTPDDASGGIPPRERRWLFEN